MIVTKYFKKRKWTACFTLTLAALLALPLSVEGQQQRPFGDRAQTSAVQEVSPEEGQYIIAELRLIENQTAVLEQWAMERHPELKGQGEKAQALLDEAMRDEDPESTKKLGEYRAALQSGDEERIEEFRSGNRAWVEKILEAEGKALEREEVVAALKNFEKSLFEAMVEINPHTPQILQRAKTLSAHLNTLRKQAAGQ